LVLVLNILEFEHICLKCIRDEMMTV